MARIYRPTALAASLCLCGNLFARPDYFTPEHRLSGVGVDRAEMTPRVLDDRTDRMIESETFAILREPHGVAAFMAVLAGRPAAPVAIGRPA